MLRVLTAIILIPLVLLLVFAAPVWMMAAVLTLVALLCMREFLNLCRAHGLEPVSSFAYPSVAIFFLLPLALPQLPMLALFKTNTAALAGASAVVLSTLFFIYGGMKVLAFAMRRDTLSVTLPSAGATLLGVSYIAGGLVSLWIIWLAPFGGALGVLWLFVVVWSGDIFAYYVGRAIGRHKLAPRISPGKSIEGGVASLVAAVALGWLVADQLPRISAGLAQLGLANQVPTGLIYAPAWVIAAGAAVINIVAQLGDLMESAIKRGAGVKDSGTILPGHGGMLDRIDALLTAAPVGLLFLGMLSLVFLPPATP